MRILHSALLLLTLAVVQFQAATPPSLSVVNLPIGGTVTATDAQGNIYFTGGAVAGGVPVTPGAPQTQPGGGNCAFGGEAPLVAHPEIAAAVAADTCPPSPREAAGFTEDGRAYRHPAEADAATVPQHTRFQKHSVRVTTARGGRRKVRWASPVDWRATSKPLLVAM